MFRRFLDPLPARFPRLHPPLLHFLNEGKVTGLRVFSRIIWMHRLYEVLPDGV